ncbi:MAG: energy-coupling factor ABC transporter ATP-binding protein [Clostridiales Family XIII bacterium]|nr:energy-coupling factor ABC transporter ATP-binding protein [Clostridiales Family XIII bacterium]
MHDDRDEKPAGAHRHRHPHGHGPAPLRVSGLTVRYSDGTAALRDVSIDIKAGEKVALIGANGAGKTSLFLSLVGILRPDAGTIIVGDVPVDKDHLLTVRRKIGLVFQNPDDQLFMPRIYDDIAFGPRNFGHTEAEVREKVEAVLEALGAAHLATRSSLKLSGGEKRVCAIASVLVMQPRLLLFDEPTAFLDMKAKARFMEILGGLGQTRIIATHDPALAAAVSDRVIVLEGGSVTDDGPAAEVLARQKFA